MYMYNHEINCPAQVSISGVIITLIVNILPLALIFFCFAIIITALIYRVYRWSSTVIAEHMVIRPAGHTPQNEWIDHQDLSQYLFSLYELQTLVGENTTKSALSLIHESGIVPVGTPSPLSKPLMSTIQASTTPTETS